MSLLTSLSLARARGGGGGAAARDGGRVGNAGFAPFVHAAFTARYGVPSAAERGLHDFFFNVRALMAMAPRARIFRSSPCRRRRRAPGRGPPAREGQGGVARAAQRREALERGGVGGR